jgi:hypothetical protein
MTANRTSPQELKPCPFCGGEAVLLGSDYAGPQFYVVCKTLDCFCAMGEGYDRDACPDHQFHDAEAARDAWNRRTL